MELESLLKTIREAAFEVRKQLTNGYLESVYQNALAYELTSLGIKVETEVPLKVYYKNKVVGNFRADIVVDDQVIIELKAIENLHKFHEAQLVNYLITTGIDHGFLVNYGGEKFKIVYRTRLYSPTYYLNETTRSL